MGKKTVLALTVLFSLAVLGAGLAWFNDGALVAGNTNTGAADMEFTHYRLTTDRYVTGSVSETDPATLSVSISGLYPSGSDSTTLGRARLHVTMTNVGTIPVKFDSAALEVTPAPLLDYLRSSCWLVYDEDGDDGPKPRKSWGYLQHPWGRFDELDDRLNASTKLKSLVLDPGGWISFDTEDENSIVIRLDESAPNGTQNQTLDFTLRLNFKQWNGS